MLQRDYHFSNNNITFTQDLILKIQQPEHINAYKCNNCFNIESARLESSVVSVPDTVIVMVKRFDVMANHVVGKITPQLFQM